MKEIIYTEHYALIVSDEEISYENYAIHLADKWILEVGAIHQSNGHKTIMDKEYGYNGIRREILAKYCKKIIAHRPLTDAPIFEGVPLLPEFSEEDSIKDYSLDAAKEFALNHFNGLEPKYRKGGYITIKSILDVLKIGVECGHKFGLKQAKETYKYTEEDLRNAFYNGWLYRGEKQYQYPKALNEFIQSLQQPERPKYFECEMSPMNLDEIRENGKGFLHTNTNKMVVITNSQGQTELVGKYIY
jgi:hypothetical protein